MKHLENFKSETIQSIYDFLEQDADVTNFKRDLIAVAENKKVELRDLEAEVFQYAELIKEDLSYKITFVFREDGYLGMFGFDGSSAITKYTPVTNIRLYNELKTGDLVYVKINGWEIFGTIYEEHGSNAWVCIVQDTFSDFLDGPENAEWMKYGKCYWWIKNSSSGILNGHSNLYKVDILIPNLIVNEKEIEELKETMHFALVI